MIFYLSLICISYEYLLKYVHHGDKLPDIFVNYFYSIMTYIVIILAQHLIFTYLELIPAMARDQFCMRELIFGTTYQIT